MTVHGLLSMLSARKRSRIVERQLEYRGNVAGVGRGRREAAEDIEACSWCWSRS